jgi:hypothetical protein
MYPIQDLFLESFSYELQFDMHFYMHSYLHKKNYSCKKWVLHLGILTIGHSLERCESFFVANDAMKICIAFLSSMTIAFAAIAMWYVRFLCLLC